MVDRSAAVALYLQIFWPVLAFCAGYALAKKSEPLMRATILTAMGQAFITIWDYYFPGAQSPWAGYSAMFALTAFFATVVPAGQFLAVFAGLNLGGLIFSMIGLILSPTTKIVDDNIWNALFFLSCSELIILVAFVGGGSGKSAVGFAWRLAALISRKSHRSGVAG